jgi:hypothetical protein
LIVLYTITMISEATIPTKVTVMMYSSGMI